MDQHSQQLLEDFIKLEPGLQLMKAFVLDKLKTTVGSDYMVEARVKAKKSLAGKLELKGYKYKTITDITDLLGARIITVYSSDVDRVSAMVENLFEIDWNESVDKRALLEPDRFGYQSLHYICRIPESLYKVEGHPEINQIRFEIQMRSLLQHVWAVVTHDTGYKSDVEIPYEYIRTIYRTASVLEMVDKELNDLRDDLDEYKRKVYELVESGNYKELTLDGSTFQNYLKMGPFDDINGQISSVNRCEIQPVRLDNYLEVFKMLGFKTLGDVDQMITDCRADALKLATKQIAAAELDIVGSSIGIQNLCTVWIAKNGTEDQMIHFYDIVFGERERNKTAAKNMLAQAQKLGISGEQS